MTRKFLLGSIEFRASVLGVCLRMRKPAQLPARLAMGRAAVTNTSQLPRLPVAMGRAAVTNSYQQNILCE